MCSLVQKGVVWTTFNIYVVFSKLLIYNDFPLNMLYYYLNNSIKKKTAGTCLSGSRVTVIGRLYRETDTVLKKLLILIKY